MEDIMMNDRTDNAKKALAGNVRGSSQNLPPLEYSKRINLFKGKRGYKMIAGFVCVLSCAKGQTYKKGRIRPKCIFFLGEDEKWHQVWTTSDSHSNCVDECVSFEYFWREARHGTTKYFGVCEGEGLSFDEMITFICNAYGAKYGTEIEEVPPEIWYGQFGKTPDVASDQDSTERKKMGPSILDILDIIGMDDKDRLIRELYEENNRLINENLEQASIIKKQKNTNERLLDCLSPNQH